MHRRAPVNNPPAEVIMSNERETRRETWCIGCVFYPPNLPAAAYSPTDWQELQALECGYDLTPGSVECLASRKTSCGLINPGLQADRLPGKG
jgi:hypothetical protein